MSQEFLLHLACLVQIKQISLSACFLLLAWSNGDSLYSKTSVSDHWSMKMLWTNVQTLTPPPPGGEISVVFVLFLQNIHQKIIIFRQRCHSQTSQLVSWHTKFHFLLVCSQWLKHKSQLPVQSPEPLWKWHVFQMVWQMASVTPPPHGRHMVYKVN